MAPPDSIITQKCPLLECQQRARRNSKIGGSGSPAPTYRAHFPEVGAGAGHGVGSCRPPGWCKAWSTTEPTWEVK